MQLELQQDTPPDLHPALAKATSRGLHDTAQPLTVLQGLLEFTLMQATTVEEFRESLATALGEMSRLTACFENLRQLVRLQQPAPDVCDFPLLQSVQGAADELRSAGNNIWIDSADQCWVHASPARVRQALSLLGSALAVSGGDKLRISVESQANGIAVRVAAPHIDDSLVHRLEIARLAAASAGGEIRFTKTPVSVLLVLPKAVEDPSTDKKGTWNHV